MTDSTLPLHDADFAAWLPIPEPLEVMANLLCGPHDAQAVLPTPQTGGVNTAFDRVLRRSLAKPPCVVSFSGGRDSSAILALATDVARRHGLPLPIPVSMRFAGAPDSAESEWQALMLEHLKLTDFEVVNLGGELDAVGEIAKDVLRLVGLRWPANGFMHMPILEFARGGSLLTGIGGDELFGTPNPPRSRREAVFDLRPRLRRLESAIWRRRHPPDGYDWLTPHGRARMARLLADDAVGYSHRWDHSVTHWYRSRSFAASDGSLRLLGSIMDVDVVNPFLHPEVLTEIVKAAGRHGFPNRATAMHRICGDRLPYEVITRPDKATFGGALWGPATRAFAKSWDGAGVEPELVDREALRREWLSAEPDFRTALLLHSAWLGSQAIPAS